ncbi:MAG: methyltransferase [Candidatus Methanoperedens sp.]|nr:methyltransferase [Candidatus Methanoperedens sp.]MCZ7396037.1 methyltransferase [Candidatus Methanoperedens sp.]
MAKMWTPGEDIDFETARDQASKLVLLGSAQKAGIFEALSQEKDIEALKQMLDADERALFIILEALRALGYVNKRQDMYIVSDRARALFLEQGEDYVGGSLPHFLDIMEAWLRLPEIIRGEKPVEDEKRDVSAFMDAMAARPDEVVEESVHHCLERKKNARSVLDLGGGPGKYSKAFVNRGLNAVLYDLPESMDYVSVRYGLKDLKSLALKKGDFTNDFVAEFGGELFDIVFMGNICHIYSGEENRLLIKRVRKLLKRNGMIAIEDFIRGRSPMAEMFAVNMLANTESGSTYTEAQYRDWLGDGGFREIEVIDLTEKSSQLITAFLG